MFKFVSNNILRLVGGNVGGNNLVFVMARARLLKQFFPFLVGSLGKENYIFSRWASNNTFIQNVDPSFFVDPFEQDILLTDIREVNL